MGSYFTDREREREMFLIVLLLISPAFGRPGSAQLDVGEDIVNKLDSIVHFSNEMGRFFGDSRLIGTVSEGLQAVELNILEMEAGLNTIQALYTELESEGSYVAVFNKAKSYLNQTRQELRDFAETAIKDIRDVIDLLDDLNRNNDPVLLKLAIDITKDLMLETKRKLEGARAKYQSVHQAFDNLISSVTTQTEVVDQVVSQWEAKYLEDKAYTDIRRDCQIASWYTFGLCSLIHHYENEVPLESSRLELAALKSKSDRLLRKTRILNQDIDVAIDLIDEKIDQINNWADSAEDVSESIEDYPAEYLEKYESSREAFKTELVDLKNVAEQFLVDRITTSSRLLGTDDEDLRFAEQNMLKMSMELTSARSYVEAVNEATSNLRQTREELRELAERTVTEGRNLALLLDALPGPGTLDTLLKVFLDTMKDLMIEKEEKLEEAREIYQSAEEALRDLKIRLQSSDTKRTTILNRDIDDAMVVIYESFDLISTWRFHARIFNENISKYPSEHLSENQGIRLIFKDGLNELKNDARNYLQTE